MKIKKEYLILFVLIVALSLYLVFRKRDRTQYRLPNISQVPTSEISKVEITKPGGAIVLEKKEGLWTISPGGYPADAFKVKSMLDTIGTLSLTALISESKSYERYELHKERRVRVKAWSGENLTRAFDVGKVAPSFRHTFVKIEGDDRVYHARENFRGSFDQTVENLRDKAVLRFDQDEIQKVEITKGEASVTMKRKSVPVEVAASQEGEGKDKAPPGVESMWQTSERKEVDESELRRLLDTLSKLNCSAYIEGRKKEEFRNPVYTLQLEGEKTYTLSLFEKTKQEDKTRPALSSENDYPFLLPDFQANRIMISPQKLLKKPDESS